MGGFHSSGAVGNGCCLHSFSLYPPRCPPRLREGGPPPNNSENSTRVPVVVVYNKAEIWKLYFNWLLVEDLIISTASTSFPKSLCRYQYGMPRIGNRISAGYTGIHIPASWPHGHHVLCNWDRDPRHFQEKSGEVVNLCFLTHFSGEQGGGFCILES